MGGLGNQLFQIFAVLSIAIKRNMEFKFINADQLGIGSTTVRPTYWKSFLSKLSRFLFIQYPEFKFIFREDGYEYKNIPSHLFPTNENIMIFGYFQSYKYFQQNFKLICLMLDIYEKQQEVLNEFINNTSLSNNDFIKEDFLLNNTISLHFRIGDYKNVTYYHPIMTYEYYKNALIHILSNTNEIKYILYFCEEKDLTEVNQHISKLQNDFGSNISFIRANNNYEDWKQLLLMSCCKYNIIANSTFSWWGAYLNSNEEKIVCYPSVWFGEAKYRETPSLKMDDLFPPSWVKISI
jgi:hypothetical protein